MIPKHQFPIPEGVIEVKDDYQLNLAHYELLHLKPKGTILFAKETREIEFQFFATENKSDGIFARVDEPLSPNVKRILDYIEKYPRTECFVTVVLLQFKLVFIASKIEVVHGAKQRTFRFQFPDRFLKTHRRKFIRIPFNENFPAELRFQTEKGQQTRRLKDLSREGIRVKMEPTDGEYLVPGTRLKQASIKVLNREMPVGLTVVSVYSGQQVGMRILAISEEDKVWIRDCIRVLMKQILNLPDAPFDDEIERDPNKT
jgi:hypothetical protein